MPNDWKIQSIGISSALSHKGHRVEDTKAYQKLQSVDRSDLDMMEQMWYDKLTSYQKVMFIKPGSHENALQIIINTVEGDYSQLSTKLAKIAEAEDKELGIREKSLKIKTDEEYDRDW